MSCEDREDVVKAWNEFKKKYPELPGLEELEEELEIKLYEPVLLNCISVLMDRLGQVANHVEVIMNPGRMGDMIEAKFYTDKEKNELFAKYKEMVAKVHELAATVYADRKERAKMIGRVFAYYKKEVKPFMKEFMKKQVEGWKKKETLFTDQMRERYVG